MCPSFTLMSELILICQLAHSNEDVIGVNYVLAYSTFIAMRNYLPTDLAAKNCCFTIPNLFRVCFKEKLKTFYELKTKLETRYDLHNRYDLIFSLL